MSSPYDAFAWFYNRYWASPFQAWQRPALERLLYSSVTPPAQILDLCCGAGNLAEELAARKYGIVGLDSSVEMLQIARQRVPQATFLQADASAFVLESRVDAAVCLFDSLNHMLQAERVQMAFRGVCEALKPGGCFLLDMNTREAYGERWNQSVCEVQPDHAFFIRGGFDPLDRIGTTQVTLFRLMEGWQRWDVEMRQRPWEIAEIEPMLRTAGFDSVESYRPVEELGMVGHYGIGRIYIRACRNQSARIVPSPRKQ